jgi:YfiR/HmsC-like
VRELGAGDVTAQCQALLVDDALLAARPALRHELRALPLLTFADGQQAADAAVCIRLDLVEGRVSFTVDLGVARGNGLTLSSRLLRLAREVRE